MIWVGSWVPGSVMSVRRCCEAGRYLWPDVVAFDNLLQRLQARRGKGGHSEVQRFELNLERELLTLQRELEEGEYRPGEYHLFTLYERKPRLIAAAPFRDRVVHHALMNRVDPPIDRSFIYDSYACRTGKGVHAAVDRYQHWAQRYTYVLKLDVSRYFPCIDHLRLKEKLSCRIKDHRVLALFGLLIDTSPTNPSTVPPIWFPGDDLLTPLERPKGIPIGNLTSQFMANLYLDGLDHFIKERLRVRAYLRYVDDLILMGDDLAWLKRCKAEIIEFLTKDRLCLHPTKARAFRISEGIDLFGYRVWPSKRCLRNDNGHRFARRLRRFAQGYKAGRLEWSDFNPSVQSWIGHASHGDTEGLRRVLFNGVTFVRSSPAGNRA